MNAQLRRRFNLWREIAILMIILMDVSWITPWFRSLTPQTYSIDPFRILICLLLTVLLSYLLIISMEYLHLKNSVRRGLVIVFLIIASLVVIKLLIYNLQKVTLGELLSKPIKHFSDMTELIPVEFIIIATTLVAFWRGLTLAQESIGPSAVKTHFVIGIIMYVAFIFLITLVTGEDPGGYYFLFLFCSLMGISTARMTVIEVLRGSSESKFEYSWFIGIVIAGGIVAGLSAMISGILVNKFTWIGALFLGLFSSILVVIWIILNPIMSYIISIASKLFNDSNAISTLEDNLNRLNNLFNSLGQKVSEIMEKSGLPDFFSRWGPTIKTIILVIIIVLMVIGIFLWMRFRLWRDRQRQISGKEENSNLSGNDVLRSIMDSLLRRWLAGKSSLQNLNVLRRRERARAGERIRQIYGDLLELSESLGQSRPESRTPLEFLPKLVGLFPGYFAEVNQITHAYVSVRYGQQPESLAEVKELEAAWIRVRTAGNELLKNMKSK